MAINISYLNPLPIMTQIPLDDREGLTVFSIQDNSVKTVLGYYKYPTQGLHDVILELRETAYLHRSGKTYRTHVLVGEGSDNNWIHRFIEFPDRFVEQKMVFVGNDGSTGIGEKCPAACSAANGVNGVFGSN
jgi:hypothetical protein